MTDRTTHDHEHTDDGADRGAAPPPPTAWPILNSPDAPALIAFLERAFGFVTTLDVRDDADPDVVVHSEHRWPEGGGVMVGTAQRPDSEFSQLPTGNVSIYVVTDRPDQLFARAVEAGAVVIRELTLHDYGSREFSVRDPDGNLWSFGTYRGAPG